MKDFTETFKVSNSEIHCLFLGGWTLGLKSKKTQQFGRHQQIGFYGTKFSHNYGFFVRGPSTNEKIKWGEHARP